MRLYLLLLPMLLCAGEPVARFASQAELEAFLFPDEEHSADSLEAAFAWNRAGLLVTMAGKVGPPYAAHVAATIPHVEFRQHYHDLARYLDLFGPCQKKNMGTAEGWWSSYTATLPDSQCGEVAKVLAANMMWSQIHYCRQLVTGEVKPKVPLPAGAAPPWRLDEPPVETVWLKADLLYQLADAALKLGAQDVLSRRAAAMGADADKLRQACMDAVHELDQHPANRELTALALAKLLVRGYEAVHLRHLEMKQHEAEKIALPY